MTVVMHQVPQAYTPSDNPVVWTFSSDKTAEANFVYLVQVYVNDVTHSVKLIYPESGAVAKFDASSIASFVTQQPTLSSIMFQDALNHATIKITVKERYGEPPIDQATVVGTNITVFKAGMTNRDFINWLATDYITSAPTSKWVTPLPTDANPRVRPDNEAIRLTAITDESSINMAVRLYDADDVLIVSNNFLLAAGKKIIIMNVTPQVIIDDGTITLGEFESAAYYTVGNNAAIEHYRIDLNHDCLSPRAKRIHFLTQFGSIESLTFEAFSMEKGKIKSSSYERPFGEFDGNDFDFNLETGTDIDYAKVVTRQLVVQSDWISEAVQNWLVQNCYASPAVYEEGDSYNLIRRMILQTSYKFNYKDTDLIFREQITLQLPTMKSATL